MDRRSFVVGAAAAAAGLAHGPASAQAAYPTHAITFINPFPPGGAADVVGAAARGDHGTDRQAAGA